MRHLLRSFLGAFLAFAFLAPASATTLTETVGTDFGPANGPSLLTPFDPTLGTLTSVDVSINGTISAQVQTNQNLVPVDMGLGGIVFVPEPIPFSVFLDQSFLGAIQGFSFFQPATIQLNGVGQGVGETEDASSSFFYGFHFDSSTDFIGEAGISSPGALVPPIFALGTLASFTDTFFPLIEELTVTQPSAIFQSTGGQLLTWSDSGGILVQYNYTPAPTPAPEPSSMLLLATGLLGLAGITWRKNLLA